MNRKISESLGMALLSLPTTQNNRINNKRRDIWDMETTSAANMLSTTQIRPKEPMIICGRYAKALPIVRQLVKQSPKSYLLLGTEKDLDKNSCIRWLDIDWEYETPHQRLSEGNGMFVLKPGSDTNLALKEYISGWDSHLLILCLGNGLQVDQELLSLLNSVGHYILLSETLQRSVKCTEGCKLTVAELLTSMDYILVSSIGTAAKDLMKILPDYECEKVTNTIDFSLHQDAPHDYKGKHQDAPHDYKEEHHHCDGSGLRFSQSKTLETQCIITQEKLTKLQDSNTMLIYNARLAHTWVARISG